MRGIGDPIEVLVSCQTVLGGFASIADVVEELIIGVS